MMVSRRQFLKGLGASLGVLLTQALPSVTMAGTTLPVPPSLMLHSRHRWLLPDILDWMVGEGYQGIHYLDFESALNGQSILPTKPVIISIDDIAMDLGNPAFDYFVAMKDLLVEASYHGVFAVITRPNLVQSDERWAQVAEWLDHGIEFATHTADHTNLDEYGLTDDAFRYQIVDSANMITERTGKAVRTLITPYGGGYNRETAQILPQIVSACQEVQIRWCVGIVDGRVPVSTTLADDAVVYVGRTKPGTKDTLEGTIYEMNHWTPS